MVGAVLLALVTRVWAAPLWIDDAYITFRYARNIAVGNGFVYNIGEPILGTSAPLYVLILALFQVFGILPETASILLGVVCDVLLLVGFGYLAWQAKHLWVGLVMAVWVAVYSPFVYSAVSGMETAFYSALVLSSFCLYVAKRIGWAILTSALVALTRPEGFLVLVAIVVAIAWRREWNWRDWIVPSILLFVWAGFAFSYFGSPIPQSVLAKAAIYPPYADPLHNTVHILGTVSAPFVLLPGLLLSVVTASENALALVMRFLIFMVGLVFLYGAWQTRHTRLNVVALWGVLNFAFFALPNRFLFPWYTTPLLGGFIFLTLVGTSEWAARCGQRVSLRFRHFVFFVLASAITLFLFTQTSFGIVPEKLSRAQREQTYLCIGRALALSVNSTATVASPEIGALGYGYPGYVQDLIGLVSPKSVTYYLASDFVFHYPHSIPLSLLVDTRPDILVLFDNLAIEVVDSAWLTQNYRPIHAFRELHPHYGSLFVYARNDVDARNIEMCAPR